MVDKSMQLVLKQGERGKVALLVQRALNRRCDGGELLVEDGACGPATMARAEAALGRVQVPRQLSEPELLALGIRTRYILDLSGHNEGGNKDLVQMRPVAKFGIDGVYFKVSENRTYVNKEARRQAQEALECGLAIGGYHFNRPSTDVNLRDPAEDARAEARHYLDACLDVLGGHVQLPHALDAEDGLEKAKTAAEDEYNADWLLAAHEVLEADKTIVVKAPPTWPAWLDPSLDYTGRWAVQLYFAKARKEKLARIARRQLWLASYNAGSEPARMTGPWETWLIHQFTNKAKVPGVDGVCDLSRYVYLEA